MRYFIVSDIHSHLEPLKKELKKFRFNSKRDTLVIAGDLFDRGEDTVMLFDYLKTIPNKILIRGNHEDLYFKLLEKDFPDDYDFSNGTVKTFCHIAGIDPKFLSFNYHVLEAYSTGHQEVINLDQIDNNIKAIWNEVRDRVKESEITAWIKDPALWCNYFEMDKFVITHSFVPVNVIKKDKDISARHMSRDWESLAKYFAYNPNWREAMSKEWQAAHWGCPFAQYKAGLFKEDKTLVVGHWTALDFRVWLDVDKYYYDEDYTTYVGKKYNIIALDACTHRTDMVNVLVIDGKNDSIIDYTKPAKRKNK